jgi:trehalose 6-phosphate synthase
MGLEPSAAKHVSNRETTLDEPRLVVVSNRLPIVVSRKGDGKWDIQPGSGGLVHSLKHPLQERQGVWFGWSGVPHAEGVEEALHEAEAGTGYELRSVPLTEEQVENYYFGFSNEIIWPLFHDMISRCRFLPTYWKSYQEVNRRFAQAIAANTEPDSFVWVQDYHLMLVARELNALRAHRRTGFFLHIPFPPVDIYTTLPWRFQVLQGLLDYDAIGLQSARDVRNFVQCVREMLRGVEVSRVGDIHVIKLLGREVLVGNFPIGIDFEGFDRRARSDAATAATHLLREKIPDRSLMLGIDRLDYTKGIPERLYAFRHALRKYPELLGNISMIQVVIPSREVVTEYRQLKEEVERTVSEINGEFTRPGWIPVHYLFRSLSPIELVSYYRASDISLVTPLKDGMNLISKEYLAANVDENGVLILSEMAGSAAQLGEHALLVNPHDVEGAAAAIYQAYAMDADERRRRSRALRQIVAETDVFWWTNAFLAMALDHQHRLEPPQRLYMPSIDVRA